MLRKLFYVLRDEAGDGGAGGGTEVVIPALPENWHSALPEDQRAGMESYKDIPALVKTLHHAQSMVGADKAVIPGKDAKPEDWNTFYGKIGKPQNQEAYDTATDLGTSPMNEDMTKSYKKFAFDNNLLPTQAKAVVDWLSEANKSESTMTTQKKDARLDKEMVELKGLWGEKYESNLASSKDAFRQLADKVPGSWDWMVKSGIAGEPMMLKLFSIISSEFKEGKLPQDGGTEPSGDDRVLSNKIMADFAHPYHDKNHPNHKFEVEEMNKRFARLHPN